MTFEPSPVYQVQYVNQEYPEDSSNLGVASSLEGAKTLAQTTADEYRAEDGLDSEAILWDNSAIGTKLTGTVTMPGHISDDSWFEITATKLA